MSIKTIAKWYVIGMGLLLLTSLTGFGIAAFVVNHPLAPMTSQNRDVGFNAQARENHLPMPATRDPNLVSPNEVATESRAMVMHLQATKLPVSAETQDADYGRRAKEIALNFRDSNPEQQAKLRQELGLLIEKHFESRQQQRQQEIDQLGRRVDSLRDLQLRRQQNKDEILKRRIHDLLDPDTDLEWTPSSMNGKPTDTAATPSKQVEQIPKSAKTDRPVTRNNFVPSAEPRYEGVTLTEWLELLKTERSLPKIKTALLAMKHLGTDVDPQVLVRATLVMSQSVTSLRDEQLMEDLTRSAIEVLLVPSDEIVVAEILAELNAIVPRRPSNGLKSLITSFLGTAGKLAPISGSDYFGTYYAGMVISDSFRESFSQTVQRRSRQLISALVRHTEKDFSQDEWVVETAHLILELSNQPLSSYPNLIPIVERVFRNSNPNLVTSISAAMLGESRLYLSKVCDFFRRLLKRDYPENSPHQFYVAINPVIQMARTSPEAVSIFVDELTERWKRFSDAFHSKEPLGSNHSTECVLLISGLGQIGDPAKPALPLLREIELSSAADTVTNFVNPRDNKQVGKIRDHVAYVIQQIEEAKPRPKTEPLSDDEPSMTAKELSIPIKQAEAPEPRPANEKTFDGIPYSQWRKILETEQKPERLAAAMEACSRLAKAGDEPSIARGIFQGASLFEIADDMERMRVWNTARQSLPRLPPNVVADELVRALQHDGSYQTGRRFQGQLLLGTEPGDFEKIIATRADEVIFQLVKLIRQGVKGSDSLFAAASNVWRNSDRPLSDFEDLKTMISQMIDDGPKGKPTNPPSESLFPFRTVVSHLIEKAPETPDLALNLAKHAGKSPEVIALIGKLGSRAEPAVPMLVDLFLQEWKFIEAEFKSSQLASLGREQTAPEDLAQHQQLCNQVIETLGEIGHGQKGFDLLRQLLLLSPPPDQRSFNSQGINFNRVEQALKKFGSNPPSQNSTALFSDFSLIRGQWTLRTAFPGKKFQRTPAAIGTIWFELGEPGSRATASNPDPEYNFNWVGWWPNWRYEMDESKNPKQITVFKVDPVEGSSGFKVRETPNSRRHGIYELTETTLRIQFANVGDPRPTELVNDTDRLSKGEVLLEFDRKLDELSAKTSNPE